MWRYCRFALRYRDVEELLAERGVILTYETVRQWCRKFGQTYANALRRRRPRPGDKWPLDEAHLVMSWWLSRSFDDRGSKIGKTPWKVAWRTSRRAEGGQFLAHHPHYQGQFCPDHQKIGRAELLVATYRSWRWQGYRQPVPENWRQCW